MGGMRWLSGLLLLAAVGGGAAGAGDDPATASARTHFQAATRLYDVAKFQAALEEFTAAYEAKPMYDFLFNIGQCHRRLGNHDAALFFYRGFLSHLPDGMDRREADRLIGEVEAAKAAKAVAAEEAARLEELRRRAPPVVRELEPARKVRPAVVTEAMPDLAVPFYKRGLFWGVLGAVAVVGAVVAVLAAALANPEYLPMDKLGTIDARR